jgi:hypothetical protein
LSGGNAVVYQCTVFRILLRRKLDYKNQAISFYQSSSHYATLFKSKHIIVDLSCFGKIIQADLKIGHSSMPVGQHFLQRQDKGQRKLNHCMCIFIKTNSL